VEVVHGNPHDFVATHKLTTYLKHAEICDEIAQALAVGEASPGDGAARERIRSSS
jgi:hypothetical protein